MKKAIIFTAMISAIYPQLIFTAGATTIEQPAIQPTIQSAPQPIAVSAEPAAESKWKLFTLIGSIATANSSYMVKNTSGITLYTSEDKSKISPSIGAEALFQTQSNFAVFGSIQWNKYNYRDGTPADTHLAFLVGPRVQKTIGIATPWLGLGVGLLYTSFGQYSATSDGVLIAFDNESTFGLTLSPKIGMDLDFKSVILGFEANYLTSSGTFGGSAASGSNTSKFNFDIDRSWINLAARLGMRF